VKRRTTLIAYLFLLPALSLLAVFTFYPVLFGTVLSLFEYDIINPPRYVGLGQFQKLLGDRYFWIALTNSAKYVLVVPVIQLCSILLAVLVNRRLRAIGLFRAAYYIPVITSWPVVGIMWTWMYDQQGVVNWVLRSLAVIDRPISWLSHPTLTLYAVMFVTLWKGLGWYMVIYLAGLQSIPTEYEEAAMIDGASRARVFWHITVPLLRPYVLLASLVSTMAAVKVFEEIYVMTRGGPDNVTSLLLFYIYEVGFKFWDLAYASALTMLLLVILALLAIGQFVFLERRVHYQ